MARQRKSKGSTGGSDGGGGGGGEASAAKVDYDVDSAAGSKKKGKSVSTDDVQNHRNHALPWSSILAGQAGSVPIVFTRDAMFFFVATASSIRVYETQTGRLVSTLSSSSSSSTASATTQKGGKGTAAGGNANHTALITGLLLNPHNPAQLISSSLDGTVKVWDYYDAKLLRSISLNFPITHICVHPTLKDKVVVCIRKPRGRDAKTSVGNTLTYKGPTNAVIQLVHLKGGRGMRERVGKTRNVAHMALSTDGRFAVIVGRQKIFVAQLDRKEAEWRKFVTDVDVTRVAFHPQSNTFATGHSNGQIRVWYFLNDVAIGDDGARNASHNSLQLAPNTMLHWHAHAVSALRFSDNGALLLSGGEESTLVVWQLATKKREYVPRLGGSTIMSISTLAHGQGEFVTAMQDGSVVFIGAVNLKASRTLPGLLANSSLHRTMTTTNRSSAYVPFDVEAETGNLVTMAGHPSALQFLAVESNDAQVMQLEVVPSNRISRPDDQPLNESRVEHVCFSRQRREWMATVDRRASGEVCLRIWGWDERRKTYIVNTRFDEPHGQGVYVKSITFSPRKYSSINASASGSPLLVSIGSDDRCLSWRLVGHEAKKGTEMEQSWVARSAFDYRKLALRSVAFSMDGSLLALAHGRSVSLWDAETNEQLFVSSITEDTAEDTSRMAFVGKGGGRYLAIVSDKTFSLFDVVQARLAYSVSMTQSIVGVGALQSDVVVVSSSATASTVSIFSTQSSNAQRTYTCPYGVRAFVVRQQDQQHQSSSSSTGQQLVLFALTSDYDVMRVGDEALRAFDYDQANPLQRSANEVRRRTVYDELLGPREDVRSSKVEHAVGEAASAAVARDVRSQDVTSLFDMPSHLLPPAHMLFEPFVAHMLPPRQKKLEERRVNENGEQDEDAKESSEAHQIGETSTRGHTSGLETTADRMTRISTLDLSMVTDMFANLSANAAGTSTTGSGDGAGFVQTNGKEAPLTNGKREHSTGGEKAKKGSSKAEHRRRRSSVTAQEEKIEKANGLVDAKVGRKRKSSVGGVDAV